MIIRQPSATGTVDKYDVLVSVLGGAPDRPAPSGMAFPRRCLDLKEFRVAGGRPSDPRPESERAQKVRTKGRTGTVPVLEEIRDPYTYCCICCISCFDAREGRDAFPFILPGGNAGPQVGFRSWVKIT
jgi:hypothetical protein